MNAIKITTFLLLAAILFSNTACSEQKKATQTTMEDVKKETVEAVETAGSFTMEQRQAFQRKLTDKLTEYDRNIATLKQQLTVVTTTAGQKTEEKIEMLQAKLDDIKKRSEELKDASGEAWEDLRKGLERAGDDLDKSFTEAMKNFSKSSSSY